MTAIEHDAPDYIVTAEFAAMARTAESTIRYRRMINEPGFPIGFKFGRRVLYVRSEVIDWLEGQRLRQRGESEQRAREFQGAG